MLEGNRQRFPLFHIHTSHCVVFLFATWLRRLLLRRLERFNPVRNSASLLGAEEIDEGSRRVDSSLDDVSRRHPGGKATADYQIGCSRGNLG